MIDISSMFISYVSSIRYLSISIYEVHNIMCIFILIGVGQKCYS